MASLRCSRIMVSARGKGRVTIKSRLSYYCYGQVIFVNPTRIFPNVVARIGEHQCPKQSVGRRRASFGLWAFCFAVSSPGSCPGFDHDLQTTRSESTFRGKRSLLQRPDDTIRRITRAVTRIARGSDQRSHRFPDARCENRVGDGLIPGPIFNIVRTSDRRRPDPIGSYRH
jgi:hypothetical protein